MQKGKRRESQRKRKAFNEDREQDVPRIAYLAESSDSAFALERTADPFPLSGRSTRWDGPPSRSIDATDSLNPLQKSRRKFVQRIVRQYPLFEIKEEGVNVRPRRNPRRSNKGINHT